MHIEFTIPISGNILGGVISGMLVMIGFLAFFSLVVLAVTGMTSLGSAGVRGMFTKKSVFGMLVYIASGGAVGGLVAATGLPWYVAGIVTLLLLIGLYKVMQYYDERRTASRNY